MTQPDDESRPAVRHSLRAATRDEHSGVDLMMSGFDLSRRDGYAVFLEIHRSALFQLQPNWRSEDYADFLAMTGCLDEDLKILGVAPPLQSVIDQERLSDAKRLGVAYVIRGSRLGSAILARRVPQGLPTSYLTFAPLLSWPAFLQKLEHPLAPYEEDASSDLVAGAKLAFKVFADIATRVREGIR